jgi:hypothetical protein
MLQQFSRIEFKNLAPKYNYDYFAKGFASWEQFMAMMFCQLGRTKSLREHWASGISSGNIQECCDRWILERLKRQQRLKSECMDAMVITNMFYAPTRL